MLDTEAERMTAELAPLGVLRMYLIGDYARGRVGPETELELLIVQQTEEPFRRRADFFVSHVRPRIGTRFIVYTPQEFEDLEGSDPLIAQAQRHGELLYGG
ncbi:MAG: hypothetical protein HY678_03475 [Chloroflexi bacterium]|nr:hypothetical protein [Chloroflexota bacterium]